jgi:hypothetical protein
MFALSKVDCKYGAPMGRRSHYASANWSGRLYARKVALDSGGYDSGGAYWGHSQTLFCVYNNQEGENEIYYFERHATRADLIRAVRVAWPQAWIAGH